MKRIELLLMVFLCSMISLAQGFKDLVEHNMVLTEYGKMNNAGGYEWKIDKNIHEDWMIQADGRIKQSNYKEKTTNYTYYTISKDGNTLYQYKDKAKKNRVCTMKIANKETENGLFSSSTVLTITDDLKNKRKFHVF